MSRDFRVPCCDGPIALFILHTLSLSRLGKLDKIRGVRWVCDVSFAVKVKVALIIFCFLSCMEWKREMAYILKSSIFRGSESCENTLEIIPIENANWRVIGRECDHKTM